VENAGNGMQDAGCRHPVPLCIANFYMVREA